MPATPHSARPALTGCPLARRLLAILMTVTLIAFVPQAAPAGELVVKVQPAEKVEWIGVVRRFNQDGTLARPVDPKARLDAPHCDARSAGASATFRDLPAGTYDVIVFLKDGTRLEGYHWPIFNEFDDPHDPAFASPPPDDVAALIREKISETRYYENRVSVLAMAGDEQQVRVLMQLLRDRATSFDAQFGAPVATLRYEVWQFSNNFGGWTRDRHSKVLHRVLDAKSRVLKQTWLWDPSLGGVEVSRAGTATLEYAVPSLPNLQKRPGLK